MAFDHSTRNRLQKFVNDARDLLTEEFTRQLQATYGLDPKAGSVAVVNSLTHLDNRQRQTALILRDTLAHYLASTHGRSEADRSKQALTRIVREQAFTVLNRLAALKMAEARGFLLESITKGYNSKGFQLYKQLASTAQGDTGDAYSKYLYSVFDEFSLDLKVLFDRHSAQGRLFPREPALLELIALINHHEIGPLWAEDETIGWIYQYFNSQKERKIMRTQSQTPRNSRELAVRNQFFTPRYVVEFLTDNTLGRIWYEMTQGNTQLVDSCRYLVRRPAECFLKSGKQAPVKHEDAEKESLSQEELLKQPVYIPHRAMKDPRCIRMLDPACGSMHFGLYAFDLFERIYEEAWQIEAELGAKSLSREGDLEPLQETFESFEAYKNEIPRLIIEHNIHGVDIDPRAVQIAGLSLWQRAQRAWQQQGVKSLQRPAVRRSNIVCAEPMPGEKVLLQEFASSLTPPVLGQLLEAVFEKMQFAGEAGTLLKIEEEIQSSIHQARDQWQARSGSHVVGDMFQAELDESKPQKKLNFDLSGIDDISFWDGAEQLILGALSDYADKAEYNSDQKRLFAEDAAEGFAFIDLCSKRFDVVLMNPPFGKGNKSVSKYLNSEYPGSGVDELGSSFYTRALNIVVPNGLFGAISSRTCFYLYSLAEWRRKFCLGESQIVFMADLGEGILDDAMNETACYVVRNEKGLDSNAVFGMFHDIEDKEEVLSDLAALNFDNTRVRMRKLVDFVKLPDAPLCYWVSNKFLNALPYLKPLDSTYASVQMGLAPRDEYRYSRGWWEVPRDESRWKPYAKGGELTAYYSDVELVLKDIDNLSEIRANLTQKYPYLKGNLDWVLHPENSYFEPGLTFGQRTTFLRTSVIPAGGYFSVAGKGIFGTEIDNSALMQAINTPICQFLVSLRKERLAIDPQYQEGDVARIPFPELNSEEQSQLSKNAHMNYANVRKLASFDEVDHAFLRPCLSVSEYENTRDEALTAIISSETDASEVLLKELNLDHSDLTFIEEQINPKWNSRRTTNWYQYDFQDGFSYLFGLVFGRWKPINEDAAMTNLAAIDPFSKESLCPEAVSISNLSEPVIAIDAGKHLNVLSEKLLQFLDSVAKKRTSVDPQLIALVSSPSALQDYLTNSSKFFDYHLTRYTKNGRKAPIYLPLQSQSKSLTLWFYYSAMSKESLYTCVNDFLDGPSGSLTIASEELIVLSGKSHRNRHEEAELARVTDLVEELKDFRDELLRIAKSWSPDLNDGVQITTAPLWRLFKHTAWQKKLKETWERLEKGDYDWTHLACNIWPERVLRKCHQDHSLAIAHDVEHVFWHEVEVPVKKGRKTTVETKLEWKPKELSGAEVNALVQAKIAEMNA
ncbi:BREX-1 system adenine-specific DNA-methyltransferase PglX [Granulosicoccus sp. 3-233]|uniref:BREX-1 system adenine-specific DNA-methyltransferase PglX n=1 Tax=Granulosicoccus sp. 3-233 TaxID=3417969 RepID=UPI003D35777F